MLLLKSIQLLFMELLLLESFWYSFSQCYASTSKYTGFPKIERILIVLEQYLLYNIFSLQQIFAIFNLIGTKQFFSNLLIIKM